MSDFSHNQSNSKHLSEKRTLLMVRWKEFKKLHPTKRDWTKELLKYTHGSSNNACKTCGSFEVAETDDPRIGICGSCGEENWHTSGTFFHKIRKPQAWLLALWLQGRGERFNAADLAWLTGVSPSTAGTIIKKILLVIKEHLHNDAGTVEISTAEFQDCIYKRSLKTPADEHPCAEEVEMRRIDMELNEQSSKIGETKIQAPNPLANLPEAEKDLLKLFSNEPVHVNTLCSITGKKPQELGPILTSLELNGIIIGKSQDTFVLAITQDKAKTNRKGPSEDQIEPHPFEQHISACVEYVKSEFRGISRKYLQLYLAAYWCLKERGRWSTDDLLRACSGAQPIHYSHVRAFVSPLLVCTIPCNSA